ncbi:MAG: hypothetical protein KAT00_12935 [Planctomycetes bacterium]|nr:hypothetical protein [Planctomycetota bacterium]
MGFLEDAYEWVDEKLGGILPGGFVPEGRTLEEQQLAQTQAEIALPAARQQLAAVQAGAPAAVSPFAAGAFPAGVAVQAPAGARGRLMTLVARVMPNGQIIPVRQYPGRPALMSSDMTAAKRVKRVGQQAARLFPRRRAASAPRYRARRKSRATATATSNGK